ncbi:MAG TPA: hypothetical protein VIN77_05570 [Aurantimonas sp.]|uniref:Lipoprotein n=1 Tax=Aurantimonas marianensis TaxID=2920428 RepID=A0A9X2HGT7_9HYPH|nr:hypothetical protein [Aurantimonas marianensis]MCP3056759.1 hypothetical protein [Aurantimonas marianensis]
MPMKHLVLLAIVGLALASCGMNRAVTVLPNTLDDLAELSKTSRGADGEESRPTR